MRKACLALIPWLRRTELGPLPLTLQKTYVPSCFKVQRRATDRPWPVGALGCSGLSILGRFFGGHRTGPLAGDIHRVTLLLHETLALTSRPSQFILELSSVKNQAGEWWGRDQQHPSWRSGNGFLISFVPGLLCMFWNIIKYTGLWHKPVILQYISSSV